MTIRDLVPLLLALSACCLPTQGQRYQGPHGEDMVEVHCGGYKSWADCYAKARELCGGDFDEVDKRSADRAYYESSSDALGSRASAGTVTGRTLVGRCARGRSSGSSPGYSAPSFAPSKTDPNTRDTTDADIEAVKRARGGQPETPAGRQCLSDNACDSGQHCERARPDAMGVCR